ncbi:MAG: MarR family winged helix-turn-helix transcriptional regulator [Stellaceae bacterium]
MPAISLSRRERSARAIAELIEQLSRSLASQAFSHGLNPAQWRALRYIAQANEGARNIGAFAKFHFTTPSSASQTISALVKKGLIRKAVGADSRSRVLGLTVKGQRKLDDDPIVSLAQAILTLSDGQLSLMAEAMATLTKAGEAGS